jgi:hypothetical protein
MRMHLSILLGCTIALSAADPAPEQFTLADGRVLIGTYDAAKGVLTLTGKIKGAVPVKSEDIVSRKPAPPPAPEVAKGDEDKSDKDAKDGSEKPKRAAAPPDPKLQLIEQQRSWINRKTTELKTYDSKIERTRRKIVDFRKQFQLRAQSENQWYDPERSDERFFEEPTVTLPRSQESNSAVRGLVTECKDLIAKRAALDKELETARKTLAELEGTVPPPATPAK